MSKLRAQQLDAIKVVYILGPGHCGSTLLNLMLNCHEEALGLSEIANIADHAGEKTEFPLGNAFWEKVVAHYEQASGESFRPGELKVPFRSTKKVLTARPDEIRDWALCNKHLFSAIASVSGKRILIDASKDWRRLCLLDRSDLFDIRVIHLVRDGRAVLNSYYRKYRNFVLGMRAWAESALFAFYLRQRQFEGARWLRVYYENLATNPEQCLRQVCSFIGIEYQPRMLRYRSEPHVGIGGNRMRHNDTDEIKLDDSWRQELPLKQQIAFLLCGGWLNALLGYGLRGALPPSA